MTVFHSWVIAVNLNFQSVNNREDKNFCFSSVLSYQHFFNIDIQKIISVFNMLLWKKDFLDDLA